MPHKAKSSKAKLNIIGTPWRYHSCDFPFIRKPAEEDQLAFSEREFDSCGMSSGFPVTLNLPSYLPCALPALGLSLETSQIQEHAMSIREQVTEACFVTLM